MIENDAYLPWLNSGNAEKRKLLFGYQLTKIFCRQPKLVDRSFRRKATFSSFNCGKETDIDLRVSERDPNYITGFEIAEIFVHLEGLSGGYFALWRTFFRTHILL